MSFQNQQHRYKRRIDKHWAPVSIEVMLQEGPEKKISILKKAQQQAAKEILHLEEASAFIEKLESEIKKYQDELNNNDPSSTSQSAQGNEPQTTETTQVEKINWMGTQTQLAYLVRLLIEKRFLEHGEHWKMIADHYTVKGKQIGNQQIATAIGNVENYNKESKPIKAETLESIVKEISSLKD
jgi:hypothetical protein